MGASNLHHSASWKRLCGVVQKPRRPVNDYAPITAYIDHVSKLYVTSLQQTARTATPTTKVKFQ